MDFVKEILKANGIDSEDSIKAIMDSFKKEVPKHMIPKSEFNSRGDKIKELEEQLRLRDESIKSYETNIEELKNAAGATDEVKTQLAQLQEKYNTDLSAKNQEFEQYKTQVETDRNNGIKRNALVKALQNNNALDAELLAGQIKLDEVLMRDGQVVDIEHHVNQLKENHANMFGQVKVSSNQPATIGKTTGSFTMDQIKNMSTQEINDNWEQVSKVLENQN